MSLYCISVSSFKIQFFLKVARCLTSFLFKTKFWFKDDQCTTSLRVQKTGPRKIHTNYFFIDSWCSSCVLFQITDPYVVPLSNKILFERGAMHVVVPLSKYSSVHNILKEARCSTSFLFQNTVPCTILWKRRDARRRSSFKQNTVCSLSNFNHS